MGSTLSPFPTLPQPPLQGTAGLLIKWPGCDLSETEAERLTQVQLLGRPWGGLRMHAQLLSLSPTMAAPPPAQLALSLLVTHPLELSEGC